MNSTQKNNFKLLHNFWSKPTKEILNNGIEDFFALKEYHTYCEDLKQAYDDKHKEVEYLFDLLKYYADTFKNINYKTTINQNKIYEGIKRYMDENLPETKELKKLKTKLETDIHTQDNLMNKSNETGNEMNQVIAEVKGKFTKKNNKDFNKPLKPVRTRNPPPRPSRSTRLVHSLFGRRKTPKSKKPSTKKSKSKKSIGTFLFGRKKNSKQRRPSRRRRASVKGLKKKAKAKSKPKTKHHRKKQVNNSVTLKKKVRIVKV